MPSSFQVRPRQQPVRLQVAAAKAGVRRQVQDGHPGAAASAAGQGQHHWHFQLVFTFNGA